MGCSNLSFLFKAFFFFSMRYKSFSAEIELLGFESGYSLSGRGITGVRNWNLSLRFGLAAENRC